MAKHRSGRRLHEALYAWRIGDPDGRFPIYSGDGAALYPGRWNRKGQQVIYASETYAAAMLEKLVHFNHVLPPNQHFLKITIPAGVSYETVTKDSLKNWDSRGARISKKFGGDWIDEQRSCLLFVPSFVAREENNILINPIHPQATQITPGREHPIHWDDRLFFKET